MLGVTQIHRLVAEGCDGLLLGRILANGRPVPLAVRLRLERDDNAPFAATGLALLRLSELTHRATPASADLALTLVDKLQQTPAGSIGWAGGMSALAGLLATLEQHRDRPGVFAPHDVVQLKQAADTRIHAALGSWERNGCRGMLGDDAIDTAIAVWTLADRRAATSRLPIAACARWLLSLDECVAPAGIRHLSRPEQYRNTASVAA